MPNYLKKGGKILSVLTLTGFLSLYSNYALGTSCHSPVSGQQPDGAPAQEESNGTNESGIGGTLDTKIKQLKEELTGLEELKKERIKEAIAEKWYQTGRRIAYELDPNGKEELDGGKEYYCYYENDDISVEFIDAKDHYSGKGKLRGMDEVKIHYKDESVFSATAPHFENNEDLYKYIVVEILVGVYKPSDEWKWEIKKLEKEAEETKIIREKQEVIAELQTKIETIESNFPK